jgi:hypothetical protein
MARITSAASSHQQSNQFEDSIEGFICLSILSNETQVFCCEWGIHSIHFLVDAE